MYEVTRRWRPALGIILLTLFVFLPMPVSGAQKSFTHVVAFGDSLSDHGGLQSYVGAYDPVTNPAGVPEVWSDGDTWIEYVADKWNAVLDNNAIAGAMTRGHESSAVQAMSDAGVLPQLGLVGQVNLYVAESPVIDARNTLFAIWIGANDLMEYGRGESSAATPDQVIGNAMTNIQTAVTALHAQGATDFLVLNLPDIGATPGYASRSTEESAGATMLATSYNSALASLIDSLAQSLPGAVFYTFDVFSAMATIMADNMFEDQTGTYMALDAQGNRTGNTNGDAEDYMFWDAIHPTTAAHELVAETVQDALFGASDSDAVITAVIETAEAGTITAVWKKGGEVTTAGGHRCEWGHFFANPGHVTWGSSSNPELFVKVWYDAGGRVDVNFFHVSVPDIQVTTTYNNVQFSDTVTEVTRYVRHYFNDNGSDGKDFSTEDGIPAVGYDPAHSPQSYSTVNSLNIGATINTVESAGAIDGIWCRGNQTVTARGDQVVWGYFYADPGYVTWGSVDNPELFVKIWFDVSGRIDVNFFHVSVPDIEVYSDYPSDGVFDNDGTAIMDDRYIRHEYTRQ